MAALLPFMASSAMGVASSAINYQGVRSQNEANRAMAREQMRFQERMSSSAYQRAVEDMRKAGLNPALAYSQGGASAPMGASAQMQSKTQAATSSALDSIRTSLEYRNTRAQIALAEASARKIQAEARIAEVQSTGILPWLKALSPYLERLLPWITGGR